MKRRIVGDIPSCAIELWETSVGAVDIPERFNGCPIRKDGWPDQRYTIGKEMAAWGESLERGV